MNRACAGTAAALTEHEYMCSVGCLRRPGRGLKSGGQSNPRTGLNTGAATDRFRLIVDDWASFNPGLVRLPRPSTIALKQRPRSD